MRWTILHAIERALSGLSRVIPEFCGLEFCVDGLADLGEDLENWSKGGTLHPDVESVRDLRERH